MTRPAKGVCYDSIPNAVSAKGGPAEPEIPIPSE
jgi:hypothetical protein